MNIVYCPGMEPTPLTAGRQQVQPLSSTRWYSIKTPQHGTSDTRDRQMAYGALGMPYPQVVTPNVGPLEEIDASSEHRHAFHSHPPSVVEFKPPSCTTDSWSECPVPRKGILNENKTILVGYRYRYVAGGKNGKPRRPSKAVDKFGKPTGTPIFAVAPIGGRGDGDADDVPMYHVEVLAEHGGRMDVWPKLISDETAECVANEALRSPCFRRYKVNNAFEPRLHYLLHDDATDDFDGSDQPGYRYSGVNMKSRPLTNFPELHRLSVRLAKLCGVATFNIGVDVVLYRAGRDKIGRHADDTQGEDRVMSVVIQSPSTPRHIVIEPQHPGVGDEYIVLQLGARDAYCMDQELQRHYVHSVPASTVGDGVKEAGEPRLVAVFRHGEQRMVKVDGGVHVESVDYSPPTLPYRWGEDGFPGLMVGGRYSRSELVERGIHRSSQKGISGHGSEGCDAIIVSGKGVDAALHRSGDDSLESLTYTATPNVGAMAMKLSHDHHKPIRVLRKVGAETPNGKHADKAAAERRPYRYDGLYQIDRYKVEQEADTTSGHVRPLYYFFLSRIQPPSSTSPEPTR